MRLKVEQKKFSLLGIELLIPIDTRFVCVDYDGTVKAYCDSHPWTEPLEWEGEHEAVICVIENDNGKPFENWNDLSFEVKTNPSQ